MPRKVAQNRNGSNPRVFHVSMGIPKFYSFSSKRKVRKLYYDLGSLFFLESHWAERRGHIINEVKK